VIDQLFGKGRKEVAARRAELRGDLARAVELWLEAELPEEAARVLVLRGDNELAPEARLLHYTQAIELAPEGDELHQEARKKRARLVVRIASSGGYSSLSREELLAGARELEALGEHAEAAAAFAQAGDVDAQAQNLARTGDIAALESLLATEASRERSTRERDAVHADVDLLVASGRRQEAASRLDAFLSRTEDALARDRLLELRTRAVRGPTLAAEIGGRAVKIVLGDEIVVGRTEGALLAPSQAVSRRHLALARDASGTAYVRDLGTRNGTQLRGLDLVAPIPIGAFGAFGADGAGGAGTSGPIELLLGRHVRVRLSPSSSSPGAIDLDLGGETYVLPLGPARIAPGWSLAWADVASTTGTRPVGSRDADASWVQLVTSPSHPAFAQGIALSERVDLLVGDAFSSERGGPIVLRVLG
jgi:hypothetical protein